MFSTQPPHEHRKFKYAKANWKRRARKVMDLVNTVLLEIKYGRVPRFSDLWDLADELVELGERADKLNRRSTELYKSERVIKDISRVANRLEIVSSQLGDVSEKLGMPKGIPVYESPFASEPQESSEPEPIESLSDIQEVT